MVNDFSGLCAQDQFCFLNKVRAPYICFALNGPKCTNFDLKAQKKVQIKTILHIFRLDLAKDSSGILKDILASKLRNV